MKSLIKIAVTLFLFFTGMLILFKFTGVLTLEKIELWMTAAKNTNPIYVALIVAGLLFCDLFMAVPTLSIMLLAGFFLGPAYAFVAAIVGVLLAGLCGYFLSRKYGDKLLNSLISNPAEREDVYKLFKSMVQSLFYYQSHSGFTGGLNLSRRNHQNAVLSLSTTLAVSSVPYALIATYAGSVSSIQDQNQQFLQRLV